MTQDFVDFVEQWISQISHKNPHKEARVFLRHLPTGIFAKFLIKSLHKIEIIFGQLFINNTHTHPLRIFVLHLLNISKNHVSFKSC